MHTSDEAFNSESNRWTLLPDLWAIRLNYVEESNDAQSLVAVIEGHTLYAMQSHSNELMRSWEVFNPWDKRLSYASAEITKYEHESKNVIDPFYLLLAVGYESWKGAGSMFKSHMHLREGPAHLRYPSRYRQQTKLFITAEGMYIDQFIYCDKKANLTMGNVY